MAGKKKVTPEQRTKFLQLKAKARIATYHQVFNSPQGKRVLLDLMNQHYVLRSTIVKDDFVSLEYQEGQRAVVLRILALLKINPNEMFELMQNADDQASGLEF